MFTINIIATLAGVIAVAFIGLATLFACDGRGGSANVNNSLFRSTR